MDKICFPADPLTQTLGIFLTHSLAFLACGDNFDLSYLYYVHGDMWDNQILFKSHTNQDYPLTLNSMAAYDQWNKYFAVSNNLFMKDV